MSALQAVTYQLNNGIILITWISKYIHYNVWDEITY